MPENHASAGADSAPGMSAAPSAPFPGSPTTGDDLEKPYVVSGTTSSSGSDYGAAEALPPLQSRNKARKGRRKDWRIASVVAVLVLAVGLSVWLLQSDRIRGVALPGVLLGFSKETGPNVQALTNKVVADLQANTGTEDLMSHPAAAIYSRAGSEFAVVVGVPQTGGVMPTAQQIVQGERSIGHADATAYPPGRAGGILTCFSYPLENGRPVQCSWIDQVTAGQVIFEGAYISNLADAAAKTRYLRYAIEK
jgi:hypothetical protein